MSTYFYSKGAITIQAKPFTPRIFSHLYSCWIMTKRKKFVKVSNLIYPAKTHLSL